jgi:hypothetical protein
MNDHFPAEIDKFQIAVSQLNVGLRQYLSGCEYPAVITLAGAAEEILGSLAKRKVGTNAFAARVKQMTDLVEAIVPTISTESQKLVSDRAYAEKIVGRKENSARNHMKHEMADEGAPKLNLQSEAEKLLKRALANYRLLCECPHALESEFTTAWNQNMGLRWQSSKRSKNV